MIQSFFVIILILVLIPYFGKIRRLVESLRRKKPLDP
jgi:hypothetical protein